MNKQLIAVFVMCSLLFAVSTLNQFAQAAKCDVKTAEQALAAAKKNGSKKVIEKAEKDLLKAQLCQTLEDAKKNKGEKIDEQKYKKCMETIPPGSYTYTKEYHAQYCKSQSRK